MDVTSMLPADVAGHGFDNNADALTLSTALTERYLGAAAKISQMALARPRGVPHAGDVLRADRSRPGQALQRRSSFRVTRRARDALLLSCRWRISVRDAAERERRRRRVRGHHRGTASTRCCHRQRQGVDRHAGRAGVRARAREAMLVRLGLSARGSEQEDPRLVEVPRAGEGGLASGPGLLRRKDVSLRRRPLRPVIAARSVPGRRRRAEDFQRDDHRASARNGDGR